ncbi:hypothetical protein [Methylocystis heyeri]|uniref:Peptidase A1 domain-containing protein n=1 Tax=Methylocystis heyeri TaxID=391905 RepID=A0A6B8KDL6_9HYPH|nr:hypothetical protein [Methylocystis heyeri]QGM44510.1 hypothetical protein H2LOC_001690 [Methylocystis heyeri]
MTTISRTIVHAVILSVSAVHSLTARADGGPPYPSGPSVWVPFANATQVGDPSKYVSPQITVGFNSPNATDVHPTFIVTMDTGSTGIIVGSSYFTPPTNGTLDPSFVGPGSETLTSSGFQFTGDWYETTINLYGASNTVVASSTVPVMAVTKVSCLPDSRICDPNNLPAAADTHYFGIGFSGGAGQPQGTPDKNAFLNVTSVTGETSVPSPGYILSTQGVQIGLTSSNTQGFSLIKLEPLLAPNAAQWQIAPASANVLTDWQHARGTITVNGTSGSAGILFDTGVTTGFLTPPIGVTPQVGTGPTGAECNGSTPPSCAVSGTSVRVSFSNGTSPVASFQYTVGPNNGAQNGNPVSPYAVSVERNGASFLNATVRFLQGFTYFYDAANGFIGLKATGETPTQFAASIPSAMAVEGVFQCFFSWAGPNFVSPPSRWYDRLTTPKYKWPYTYIYYQHDQIYVGVSSGNLASGNIPATTSNSVYTLGSDGQYTNRGALSDWLAAAGCQ